MLRCASVQFLAGLSVSRLVSLLALAGLALASAGLSHAARWESLGPEGGRIAALGVASSSPQVVYAGGAFVFRSSDGGLHWSPVSDPFPSRGPEALAPRVTALAVSPADPDRVLLASPQGLFLSTDGGSSWRRAGTVSAPVLALCFGVKAAIASTAGTVYRSLDGGATWTSAPAPAMVALCEDPQPSGAFFGTRQEPDPEGRSLLHSATGLDWSALPAPDLRPTALVPVPDGLALYAAVPGAEGGVFRVTRDGTEAVRLSSQPSIALLSVPGPPDYLLSGSGAEITGASVFRSTNGGATWRSLFRPAGTCDLTALALGADATPLVATDGAGVVSCEPDDTWRPRCEGLSMATVTGAFRRDDGMLLIAAGDRLYRSGDGTIWSRIRNRGRRSLLAVSTAKPGRILYTSASGLEVSEDYGQTWGIRQSGLPPSPDVARLVLHPTAPNTIYAVLTDGAVYRTTTGIISWKRILAPFPAPPAAAPDLALAPSDPVTLYAARSDGLSRSIDGGTTWEAALPGAPADALLAVDPVDAAHLYRATTSGATVSVAESADGGRTWTPLRQEAGAPGSGFSATFLAADPRTPGRLLLGTNRGLRVRDSADAPWRAEPAGPAGTFCLAWAPGEGSADLLCTDGGGLLRGTPADIVRASDLETALAILRLALTVPNPTPEQVAFGDRDGDLRVTRSDAALALRIALGGA